MAPILKGVHVRTIPEIVFLVFVVVPAIGDGGSNVIVAGVKVLAVATTIHIPVLVSNLISGPTQYYLHAVAPNAGVDNLLRRRSEVVIPLNGGGGVVGTMLVVLVHTRLLIIVRGGAGAVRVRVGCL